jgi:hypothetical protein
MVCNPSKKVVSLARSFRLVYHSRVVRLKTVFENIVVVCLSVCLISCGDKDVQGSPDKNTQVSKNPESKDPTPLDKLKKAAESKNANKERKETRTVKAFSFIPPSAKWLELEGATGDETYTRAKYKSTSNSVQLSISSIGQPTKGPDATNLVKTAETNFAQGIAKHPDMARSWIKSGFSLSRYADPTSGKVSVWCMSKTCKVELAFDFGSGSNISENTAIADSTTDEFFAKNPTGGAKTQ